MSNYYNKEYKILLANILDKYECYLKSGKSICSNFLNTSQFELVSNYLNQHKIPFSVYHPYDFLEKRVIYFGSYTNFVTIYKIKAYDVSHQAVLKSLFSLGFDNSLIGDIFIEDGYFYYTNLTRMNSFLENNLVIDNQNLTLTQVDKIILYKEHFEVKKVLVSSMRIDNVISKLINKSRSQVNKMILDNLILLNYNELRNNNTILNSNDILSIRKYGKYKIGSIINYTKKENIVLEIIKYV